MIATTTKTSMRLNPPGRWILDGLLLNVSVLNCVMDRDPDRLFAGSRSQNDKIAGGRLAILRWKRNGHMNFVGHGVERFDSHLAPHGHRHGVGRFPVVARSLQVYVAFHNRSRSAGGFDGVRIESDRLLKRTINRNPGWWFSGGRHLDDPRNGLGALAWRHFNVEDEARSQFALIVVGLGDLLETGADPGAPRHGDFRVGNRPIVAVGEQHNRGMGGAVRARLRDPESLRLSLQRVDDLK